MAISAMPSRNIVILGAGGYLGGSLCRFFQGIRDYSVTAVFRREPSHRWFDNYVIADAFADDWAENLSLTPPSALINCAFDFKAVSRTDHQLKYMTFDRQLATLRDRYTVRLINISSMSAYPGCKADYGREKLFIEQLFSRYGGINLRIGLLASWRRPGAAMLRLIEVTRDAKVIPMLAARQTGFWFCDLEGTVLGIYLLLNMKLNKPHTLSFCYRHRLSLWQTVNLIERRYGVRKLKLPIPWQVAYVLLLAKERFLGKSKIRADSVLDFAHPSPVAYGRAAFSRMIELHRSKLEQLSAQENIIPPGFYFLEGESVQSNPGPRRCRLQSEVSLEQFAALRQLTDA